ncbi:PTS sugar transporter subunit IIA [Atopobium sp. oral taxon 416]|uniref:PTS sugar transporter subunit IIA n=1 Tax=Atopobium sp. oral taxon 416 TaxID=712157 RepID=UPI001BA5F71F|nr:PTS sugar transporter subunit IIA [Atopobium sp. oral taxon 416]QUC03843.1 PTS sugar transporter subunit IIA [Atopobium sp. oral taxon 416]
MIWEELETNRILLNTDANRMEDVMQTVGGKLIELGYGKESYVQALIDREREYPTGLDINGVGVAIPHTEVEHVNKSGIAIATLKHSVIFEDMGSEGDVNVQLVFVLAVTDPHEHIEELQRIIQILQDGNTLTKILNSASEESVIDTIKEKEQTL